MVSANITSCTVKKNKLDTICIITARGGSKRVPRKNIRNFCGLPMIAWPTKAAVDSELFDSVIISTDDAAIAEVAVQYGANQPFIRPNYLAEDFTSTAEVLKHALETMHEHEGAIPEYVCCLYGTSAMVTPVLLREALNLLTSLHCELVMAVAEYSHPIERALQFSTDGNVFYRQPEFVSQRTQDIMPSYHDVGLFYFFSAKCFLSHGGTSFIPLKKKGLIVSRSSAFDIDTEEDWNMAEMLAKNFLKVSK